MSDIDKKGVISSFANDTLEAYGLYVIGFGGIDGSAFDDSDMLVDRNGRIIYYPGFKSEFKKIEESLDALINKKRMAFAIRTHPYIFVRKGEGAFVLDNHPFNTVEEVSAYSNFSETFGKPSMSSHRFAGLCLEGAIWMFRAGYSELGIVQALKAERHAKEARMACDKDGSAAIARASKMFEELADRQGPDVVNMLWWVFDAVTHCHEPLQNKITH